MIKQLVPEEYCLKCQGCCRFREKNSLWSPQLLKEERPRLEKAVELVFDAADNLFLCASLQKHGNLCLVYTTRPLECQLYPFLLNRRGDNVFIAADLNCPFIKERFSTEEFRQYVQYLGDLFSANQELLKNNPQLIQSYKEVQDLIEIEL